MMTASVSMCRLAQLLVALGRETRLRRIISYLKGSAVNETVTVSTTFIEPISIE
jgi:hypothetical protein